MYLIQNQYNHIVLKKIMIPFWELSSVIFLFLYFIKPLGNIIGNPMGTKLPTDITL